MNRKLLNKIIKKVNLIGLSLLLALTIMTPNFIYAENTNEGNQTVNIEPTVTPDVTNTPEATVTPDVTNTPEATVTPDVTNTPEATVTPDVTNTPEATVTPDVTNTPEPTVTPVVNEAAVQNFSLQKSNNACGVTNEPAYKNVTATYNQPVAKESTVPNIELGNDIELDKTAERISADEWKVNLTFSALTEFNQFVKPVEIVIVVDNSASMNSTRITDVKNSAISFINTLEEKVNADEVKNVSVAITNFTWLGHPNKADGSYELVGMNNLSNGLVEANTAADFDSLENAINSITASESGNGTNIDAGIQYAGQLYSNEDAERIMIVLTDGAPTAAMCGDTQYGNGDSSTTWIQNTTLNTARNLENHGVEIYSIGFHTNTTFSKNLASNPNNYFTTTQPEILTNIFTEILGRVVTTDFEDIMGNDFSNPTSVSAIFNGIDITKDTNFVVNDPIEWLTTQTFNSGDEFKLSYIVKVDKEGSIGGLYESLTNESASINVNGTRLEFPKPIAHYTRGDLQVTLKGLPSSYRSNEFTWFVGGDFVQTTDSIITGYEETVDVNDVLTAYNIPTTVTETVNGVEVTYYLQADFDYRVANNTYGGLTKVVGNVDEITNLTKNDIVLNADGELVLSGANLTGDHFVTYYYAPENHTVTYNENVGTGSATVSDPKNPYVAATTVSVLKSTDDGINTFEKENHTLVGFTMEPNNPAATVYGIDGTDTFVMPDNDVVLYAVYEENKLSVEAIDYHVLYNGQVHDIPKENFKVYDYTGSEITNFNVTFNLNDITDVLDADADGFAEAYELKAIITAENHSATVVDVKLTIYPRALEIYAANSEKTYGELDPTDFTYLSPKVSDNDKLENLNDVSAKRYVAFNEIVFTAMDDSTLVKEIENNIEYTPFERFSYAGGSVEEDVRRNAANEVIAYEDVLAGMAQSKSTNYVIENVHQADFTINPIDITVTANNVTVDTNTPISSTTFTNQLGYTQVGTLVDGDNLNFMIDYNTSVVESEINTLVNATYTDRFTVNYDTNTNYDVVVVDGDLIVNVPTPTPTPVPSSTPIPVPTATPVVPTATPVVPTATPVVPTATPVVPTATPVVPTATPVVPTATPVVIPDDNTPEVGPSETPIVIIDGDTPEARGSAWALLNLIMALLTTVTSIYLVMMYMKNKEAKDEDLYDENGNQINEAEVNNKLGARLLSIVIAIASIITFILTEDMTQPMIFIDKWTLLMVAYALVQAIVAYNSQKDLTFKRIEDTE